MKQGCRLGYLVFADFFMETRGVHTGRTCSGFCHVLVASTVPPGCGKTAVVVEEVDSDCPTPCTLVESLKPLT